MAQLRIEPLDAAPVKPYAAYAHPYEKRPRGMYPTSPELTLRVAAVKGKLFFNELFGLGSECLPCGEEDVFLHDAVQAGTAGLYRQAGDDGARCRQLLCTWMGCVAAYVEICRRRGFETERKFLRSPLGRLQRYFILQKEDFA